MGQKALLKSFAQSHGIKTFAGFFFVKLSSFYSFYFLCKNSVNLTEKLENCAKLFIPWDVAKLFCKAFYPMGKKALHGVNLTEKIEVAKKISSK